jgi:hypothetical protein
MNCGPDCRVWIEGGFPEMNWRWASGQLITAERRRAAFRFAALPAGERSEPIRCAAASHLCQDAPANCQAIFASGTTPAADAVAWALDAVPISMRLAMPCKIAARRNML